MEKYSAVVWLGAPEEHDYPAALSYLTLLYDPVKAGSLVAMLRKARLMRYKAKDILRASGLPALGTTNAHVGHNLKKIGEGRPLSPILLLRGSDRLIIADGYHRACSVYLLDEDAELPCHIV